jgi:hypothetical protein
MDEIKNDEVVEELEQETPEEELTANTDWESEAKKARGIAQRALTKLKKLGEKPKEEVKAPAPVKKESNPSELNETQLDYLDLKGVSSQEEIDVIQKVMQRTGLTVRQALQDDYVVSRLETLKKDREVKDAMPSSTKRGGSTMDSVEAALARFDSTGKLPDDFALKSKVVNAISERDSVNKPAWHA